MARRVVFQPLTTGNVGQFCAILGSSWGHPGPILGHPGGMLGHPASLGGRRGGSGEMTGVVVTFLHDAPAEDLRAEAHRHRHLQTPAFTPGVPRGTPGVPQWFPRGFGVSQRYPRGAPDGYPLRDTPGRTQGLSDSGD